MPWWCPSCGVQNSWPESGSFVGEADTDVNDLDLECRACLSTFWVVRTSTSSREVPAHWKHFPTFFKMMLKEMDETFPEKGNSWLERDDVIVKKHYGDREIPMNRHLTLELEKTFHRFMERGEIEYLKHLGNFCTVLRLRKLLREEFEGKEE